MANMRDIEDMVIANARTPFEKREFLLRNDRKKFVVARPSSMLIGGPTGSCKSVVASYISCWIVMMDGLVLLVDPHCNNLDRGLTVTIAPLRDWFLREPVDFTNKEKVLEQFEWAESELVRRELPGGLTTNTKLIFLVIDEFNEFMNRLSKAEKTRVCTIIGNIARSGAKWGINCILIGHNWDLSKTGSVRYDVVTRICTGGEYRQMSMVLDNDDKQQLKELWTPPIPKGTALVRRSDYSLHKMSFPNVTRYGCEAIADLVRRVTHNGHNPIKKVQTAFPEKLEKQKGFSAQNAPGEPIELYKEILEMLNAEQKGSNTGLRISQEELIAIIKAGTKQLLETGKVVRTKIRDELGYDAEDYEKIKWVCDAVGWNYRMSPTKLPSEEWEAIKARYDYRCLKCGKQEPEITLQPDRIIPKVKGGDYSPDNVQPLCREHCNPSKREQIIDFRTEQKRRSS
jgi:hypothetical protein